MMNGKLLPCPFCGRPAVVEVFPLALDYWMAQVVCSSFFDGGCNVAITITGSTEQEAIDAAVALWNNRDACSHCQYGAKPMTDENMRELGWVRERTCKVVDHNVRKGVVLFTCSECGNVMPKDDNYCSNCGARVVRE